MLLKAYPKINLYLHIIGRETIGSQRYHLLRSRFVRVVNEQNSEHKLYDEIEITPANAASDIVLGNFPCAVQESSVYRALQILRAVDGVELPPLRIEVCKHIPSGAGLGGGSADAGVVLRALIEHYGGDFSGAGAQLYRALFGDSQTLESSMPDSLARDSRVLDSSGTHSSSGDCARSPAISLAKSLGADVAFFLLDCDCAEVAGIGEQITPCAPAVHDVKGFELYTPEIFCDTARVYQKYSAMLDSGELQLDTQDLSGLSSSAILDSSVQNLNALYRPACALYPELESVRKELGAGWYFSGSGSSFFRPIYAPDSKKSQESTPESRDSSALGSRA